MTSDSAHIDLYPSRTGERATMRERLDPVLHGQAASTLTNALTKTQRDHYRDHGFLTLPELLSRADVDSLLAELQHLAHAADSSPEVIREPDSNAVRSLFAVHNKSRRVMRVLVSDLVLPLVEEILGSRVYVHQSRVNFKPAFEGRAFDWHSDFETWHVEDGMPRMRALSLSINLTRNTEVNGPLLVMSGSHLHYASCAGLTPENHHTQSLRRQEYGVPTREQLTQLASHGNTVAVTGEAGSAVMFDCNLMHGSASNISPYPRSNLFIVFNSVDNQLRAPYSGQPPRPEHIAARTVQPLLAP